MKTKNTYNRVQLSYLESRIGAAYDAKQNEIILVQTEAWRKASAAHPQQKLKFGTVSDEIVAKFKLPKRVANNLVRTFAHLDSRTYHKDQADIPVVGFGSELTEMLGDFGKRVDQKKQAAREKALAVVDKAKDDAIAKLNAVKREAFDALYLGDQSSLSSILSKFDAITLR